jgi:hypothetical protein
MGSEHGTEYDSGMLVDPRAVAMCLVLSIAGCSSAVTPNDAGLDASTMLDAGSDGGTDTGVDAAPPSDAGTDASMSMPTITITNLTVFGDCMPIVAPDPIHASWTATVDGASGTSATITNALLVIRPATTGSDVMQTLTVDTPTIALSGGHGSAMQNKTGADANPPAGCTGVCGGVAHLMVTFMIDGAPVFAFGDAMVGCAF